MNKDLISNILSNDNLDDDHKVSIMKKINNNLQLVTQLEIHKEDTKRIELKMNKKIELLRLKIQLENTKKVSMVIIFVIKIYKIIIKLLHLFIFL